MPQYVTSQGGPLTNLVARPLVHYVTGMDMVQPIGGEMCLSAAFTRAVLAHGRAPAYAGYGIDVHLSLLALCEADRLAKVDLGAKAHRPRRWDTIQPIVNEVFGSVHAFLQQHGRRRHRARFVAARSASAPVSVERLVPPSALLRNAARRARETYAASWAGRSQELDELVDQSSAGATDASWWAEALVTLLVANGVDRNVVLGALECLFMEAAAGLADAYADDDAAGDHYARRIVAAMDGCPFDVSEELC